MTITEMHSLFRTIGQQMGLQHVRAILPEEIDKFLNLAIIEKCRSIINSNVSTAFQDSRTVRDNPISPYNALRTLFREEIKTVSNTLTDEYYSWTSTTHKDEVLVFTSIGVRYEDSSHVYQCRIIEPTKIYHVLNDFCNAPTKTEPCCVLEGRSTATRDCEFKIYTNGNPIYKLFISYIAMPNIVKYVAPNSSSNVNCDLPDYIHNEIVELAVKKFFASVGSTSQNVQ